MSGIAKNNAPVYLFNQRSNRVYWTVKKNQSTGTVRMPIFSIFSHRIFASMDGESVIRAYANVQIANPTSIQIMAFRPGDMALRNSKSAMNAAAAAFKIRMTEKTIHWVLKETSPVHEKIDECPRQVNCTMQLGDLTAKK